MQGGRRCTAVLRLQARPGGGSVFCAEAKGKGQMDGVCAIGLDGLRLCTNRDSRPGGAPGANDL